MTPREIEAEINTRLAAAERLLASGVMVGDAGEHQLWRASRHMWALTTTKVLQGETDESALHAFQSAVTPPPGESALAEDLPAEMEAVRRGMAVLIGLRSQMQRDVPEPPPEIDRRGRRLGP